MAFPASFITVNPGNSKLYEKTKWRSDGTFSIRSQFWKHHNSGDMREHQCKCKHHILLFAKHHMAFFFRRMSTQWQFQQSWTVERWHKPWKSFQWVKHCPTQPNTTRHNLWANPSVIPKTSSFTWGEKDIILLEVFLWLFGSNFATRSKARFLRYT